MGENTKIEWADHSASPWHGCTHATADGIAHPGCQHCYAETMSVRNPGTLGIWGEDGTRVKSKSFINNLRKWNREAKAAGKVVSVFPSLCDPFEDRPELVPWREEMFRTIDECQNVRLLLLTKRPQNVRRMWTTFVTPDRSRPSTDFAQFDNGHRPNVWILASLSDQRTADVLVPDLPKLRELVPVLGLSVEPLLGPIDLVKCGAIHVDDCPHREHWPHEHIGRIDWVICGGESGPHARPMHPDWPRSIRDQFAAAGVAYFFKQWGEWAEAVIRTPQDFVAMKSKRWTWLDQSGESGFTLGCDGRACMEFIGKKLAGRLLDGVEHNAMPENEVPA